jgi:hypothetical protein
VDFTQIDFLYHFLNRMQARLGHEPLKAQLSANIQLLETVSAEIARRAFDRTPTASDTLSCDGGRATPGIDLSADFQKFWLNAPVAIPGCV